MQLFISRIICAFVALNVLSAQCVLSSQAGGQGGVLENTALKQAYLEKRVEAHSKILGGKRCAQGAIIISGHFKTVCFPYILFIHIMGEFQTILKCI